MIEQPTFAVDARVIRHQHLCKLTVVLRVELVEDLFHAPGMGLSGAEEDGLAWQHAVGVFDGLLHEFADDQGVGTLVDHLLFKLGAIEVDVLNFLALKDQLFLVF
ncbi:hypothetical protein D3C78_1437820 [compost metagenome]